MNSVVCSRGLKRPPERKVSEVKYESRLGVRKPLKNDNLTKLELVDPLRGVRKTLAPQLDFFLPPHKHEMTITSSSLRHYSQHPTETSTSLEPVTPGSRHFPSRNPSHIRIGNIASIKTIQNDRDGSLTPINRNRATVSPQTTKIFQRLLVTKESATPITHTC